MRALIIALAALTTISCTTTAVTPRLHVPEKPDYPRFTETEIRTLEACMQDARQTCEVNDETLVKLRDKDIMCRGYAAEAVKVIETNNAQSGE